MAAGRKILSQETSEDFLKMSPTEFLDFNIIFGAKDPDVTHRRNQLHENGCLCLLRSQNLRTEENHKAAL